MDQVQDDCFCAETEIEGEKATEIVEAKPGVAFSILISKTRECLQDSQKRYFEAGDLVNDLSRLATLDQISAALGRWKKSFLSKLGKVSSAFNAEDQQEATKLGATWDDCYRSIQLRGEAMDNLKAYLKQKPQKKAKKQVDLDEVEKLLLGCSTDPVLRGFQRERYRTALVQYRQAKQVYSIWAQGGRTMREEILQWIDLWIGVAPAFRKMTGREVVQEMLKCRPPHDPIDPPTPEADGEGVILTQS